MVAIQGDFERHVEALRRCCRAPDVKLLRTAEDLEGVNHAIIPGGESTTVGKLMERFGLGPALIEASKRGMPIWGTCMGMILMAKRVIGYERQYGLGLLDVTVERNAFGAQVHSFETEINVACLDAPMTAVFIRAPIVRALGDGVEAMAHVDGKVVAVRQGHLVGTSFHPELTDDARLHEWFLKLPMQQN